jgi:hypothetical protein
MLLGHPEKMLLQYLGVVVGACRSQSDRNPTEIACQDGRVGIVRV